LLDIMRKYARSWWIKTLLIAVALSFMIGFGILNRYMNDEITYAAKINDTIISIPEFENALFDELDLYRQYYGGELTEEQIKALDIKGQLLNAMIDKILELEYAQKLNIIVSVDEVQGLIAQNPNFMENGTFSNDLYGEVLSYNGLNKTQYEASIREGLTLSRLQDYVKDSAKVTDDELLAAAQAEGIAIVSLDELTPDDLEYYRANLLAVKKYEEYDRFMQKLRNDATIVKNIDIL